MSENVIYWEDRPVSELSREELLKVVEELAEQVQFLEERVMAVHRMHMMVREMGRPKK